jgi:hypothetical protein
LTLGRNSLNSTSLLTLIITVLAARKSPTLTGILSLPEAKPIAYVKKGQKVLIKGKLAPHSYDARDGEKHYITKINCSEMVDLT